MIRQTPPTTRGSAVGRNPHPARNAAAVAQRAATRGAVMHTAWSVTVVTARIPAAGCRPRAGAPHAGPRRRSRAGSGPPARDRQSARRHPSGHSGTRVTHGVSLGHPRLHASSFRRWPVVPVATRWPKRASTSKCSSAKASIAGFIASCAISASVCSWNACRSSAPASAASPAWMRSTSIQSRAVATVEMNGLPWITHCPLERSGFRKHRGRIDRVDQVDRTVQGALRSHADHFGHQLHQATFAAVGIAVQAVVPGQEALPRDGVVGAPDRMQ